MAIDKWLQIVKLKKSTKVYSTYNDCLLLGLAVHYIYDKLFLNEIKIYLISSTLLRILQKNGIHYKDLKLSLQEEISVLGKFDI